MLNFLICQVFMNFHFQARRNEMIWKIFQRMLVLRCLNKSLEIFLILHFYFSTHSNFLKRTKIFSF